jgi:hypothetical protein
MNPVAVLVVILMGVWFYVFVLETNKTQPTQQPPTIERTK